MFQASSRWPTLAAGLLVVALIYASPLCAQLSDPETHECVTRSMTCNSSVTETIDAFTCVQGSVYFDPWQFEGRRDDIVEITMRSPFLDSVLQLYDDRNVLVASDDNSGGGRDAKIVYQLERTVKYLISAGDRSFSDGSYILTLDCRPGPPTPPPPPPPIALNADQTFLQLARGESTSIKLTTITTDYTSAISFGVSGLPSGVRVNFDPPTVPSPGDGTSKAVVTIDPTAVPGDYSFSLTAIGEGKTGQLGLSLKILSLCRRPIIIEHPKNVTTTTGKTAVLTVRADGSAPLTFTWYRGHTSNTNFPLQTGPSTILQIPNTQGSEEYWVRVNGLCGVADSLTAAVVANPPAGRKRPVRR